MIQPDWRESEGAVIWRLPPDCPAVIADPHGLLQAFLNLAQNSLRAVQEGSIRELEISVSVVERRALIRFSYSVRGFFRWIIC